MVMGFESSILHPYTGEPIRVQGDASFEILHSHPCWLFSPLHPLTFIYICICFFSQALARPAREDQDRSTAGVLSLPRAGSGATSAQLQPSLSDLRADRPSPPAWSIQGSLSPLTTPYDIGLKGPARRSLR